MSLRQVAEPLRADGDGFWPVTSSPSSTIRPSIGWISPDAVRSSVVLPAPFGPSRATTVESGTEGSRPAGPRSRRSRRTPVDLKHRCAPYGRGAVLARSDSVVASSEPR